MTWQRKIPNNNNSNNLSIVPKICAWLNNNNNSLKSPPVGVHPHQVIPMVGASLHQKLETGNNPLQDPHQITCLVGHLPILVSVVAPAEVVVAVISRSSSQEVEQVEVVAVVSLLEVIVEILVGVVVARLEAEEELGVLLE